MKTLFNLTLCLLFACLFVLYAITPDKKPNGEYYTIKEIIIGADFEK